MSESLEDKRARLRSLLLKPPDEAAVPAVEPRHQRQRLEPLSFGQQGLWFVARLEGPNPAYNIPVIVRFLGELDHGALERALSALVLRHEALRTRFVEHGGVPGQLLATAAAVRLAPERVAAGEAEAAYVDEARHPFDVELDNPLRVKLFAESERRSVLVVTMHHLVSDAWSVGVLLRELTALYAACRDGRQPALPPLTVSYVDYVHWERRWLAGGVLERQLAYWRQQLRDLPSLLALPTDRPRPALQSSRGATLRFAAPRALQDGLKRLANDHRCSLFVTLAAALGLLLQRYSAQRDLTLGTGVANRRRPELEGLIGYFVNALVLRARLAPEQPFVAALRTMRETVLQALANQDAPYHRVVEELRPERSGGHSPLFQVMLTLQNVPYARRIELPGVVVEAEVPASGAAKFDLSIAVQDEPEGLRGEIEYRSDIFDGVTVERLAGHFLALLQCAVERPEAPAGRYEILGAGERVALLAASGRDRLETPGTTIHARFEERARSRPAAVAVVERGRSLTYGELDARADRLARRLRSLGMGGEAVAAVCVERSSEMVIALLAVLKAGGAYLPLAADHPVARTRRLLDDAGVELLLATAATCAALPAAGRRMVLVDQELAAPPLPGDAADALPAPPPVGEGNLAYVMYTSGSTGEPKGVAVEHRAVIRLVCGVDWMEIDDATVTLQHSPVSFDASTFEIWAPLLNGGRLVLHDGEAADVEELAERVAREGVDTLWLSAGVLPLWVEQRRRLPATASTLRYLLVGGDVVPESAVRALYRCDPGVVVINGYGPTENTTFSCCWRVPRERGDAGSLPIGRPIRGTSAYVLDELGQLQLMGGIGELHVGGAGLARGYLRKPGLTEQRFVPNPLATGGDGRLYKTGDRVRWLAGGDLEFLGRADNQVKIRGYRVELEEIEHHLMQLPEVALAAVVARDEGDAGKRLVAYAVAVRAAPPREAAAAGGADEAAAAAEAAEAAAREREGWISRCKAELRQRLPEYMVPGTFVLLDTMPLTANGKVDRRALPAPGAGDLHHREYRPPQNGAERALCAIWQEVLQVPRVGVDDDFFDLGGHSLLATQLAARVRERLHQELPLTRLFQGPSVAGVARYLAREQEPSAAAGEPLPALVPDPDNRYQPFPMTAVQQAYWLGRSGAFELGNISTHAYVEAELRDLDVARLQQAWNALIARHEMLRAVFGDDGTQRILPAAGGSCRYEIACEDLGGLPWEECEARIARLRERMSHQVFAVSEWPLFEIRVTRLPDGRSRLHFSMDGLPADAMSSMILARELDQLYEDPSAALPELTISFRDYAVALAGLAATRLYAGSRDYWQQRLAELPPAPELPLAREPGTITLPRFQRRCCILPAPSWEALQDRAREAGVTPSVLLVAAFSRVLCRWSRSRRFTLNLTLFNRLPVHDQVEALVGDFTSLILLAVDGTADEPFADFARGVQRRLWSDMEHRYYDGVEVLRLLNRRAPAGRPRLMPVVFTSALGLAERHGPSSPGALGRALADPAAPGSYGVTQTSQVWLDNVVSEVGGGLAVTWDALEELFPEGVLDAMFAAYRHLLEDLASGARQLGDPCLPPLPEGQERCRRAVNDTGTELSDCLLHELFRRQAQRQPHAPAVIGPGLLLDYADLDRRAEAVARQLRERGVRPGELVAVVMSKGWEQVAGALAVLYAGAAYLPIDAALPEDRIAMLLDRGGVRLVLTQADVPGRMAWPGGVQAITVGGGELDAPPAAGGVDTPLGPAARADDLAYVIFTSGSTGEPKGVAIDHRGAVNTVVDVNRRFRVGSGDRVLALSSLSFDLSVYDVFGVLGAGGALVLPEPSREREPAHWSELVARHGVTLWNTVPILAQLFVEELERAGPRGAGVGASVGASLRLALLSGDWVPLQLPARLRAQCPGAQVVSLGGATEASIWSIFHVVDGLAPWWTSIPYGRPLANQRWQVLAADLSPCPDWVIGDLWIGGAGLARGYWRDEEKTRRSFVRHPLTGERLYRTGDLGRRWPDGTIEFLGREDGQVKVHGHRIELGEIEAVLARHPRVAAAAVAAVGERTDRRLVAYVVPAVQLDDAGLVPGGWSVGDGGAADGTEAAVAAVAAEPLRDAARQAAFKLEQRGLRRYPESAELVPLTGGEAARAGEAASLELVPGVSFRGLCRPEGPPPAGPQRGGGPVGREQWGGWLSCLAQVPVGGHPIAKRYYPSAGSLYPVQAYCQVGAGAVAGLPAGTYGYDPAAHRLARLGPAGVTGEDAALGLPAGAGFALFLVAGREAIAPLYGGLAERFCLLEAGHMLELLASAAPVHGIALRRAPRPDEVALRRALRLEQSHRLVAWVAGGAAAAGPSAAAGAFTLRALERQSYREFLDQPPGAGELAELLAQTPDDGTEILLHLGHHLGHPAAVAHRGAAGEAGFQRWDRGRRELVRLAAADERLAAAVHAGANRGVHARAAFSLYLVAPAREEDAVLAAGWLGQALMSLAPRHGIGLCPIGSLASAALRDRLGIADPRWLVYCFEGGRISVEQTRRWPLEEPEPAPDEVADLRDYLRRKLPASMVPAAFVPLAKLPLTANGKLDREALLALGEGAPRPAARYQAPRNELERSVAAAWAAMLGRERVGVDESFFELGGNSLSAMRVVSALAREFPDGQGRLSLEAFFANPTVAAVAELIALSREARLLEDNRARLDLAGEPLEEGEI